MTGQYTLVGDSELLFQLFLILTGCLMIALFKAAAKVIGTGETHSGEYINRSLALTKLLPCIFQPQVP